ncbi:ornithine decarboxylase antizyme [Pyrenophora tritici-repentis]|nr:ornithine decarboxylase antizyme [Pyrenophora tritici-repentis]PZD43324.1 ornithine decarboxylase antizyme [Pyrenophora tritici-repentis]
MGMPYNDMTATATITNDYGIDARRYSDSSSDSDVPEMVRFDEVKGSITDYIEMWDYVGGIRFRGFVAEKEDQRAMFVFFDEPVIKGDIKAGLMALLELCEVDYFSCDRLVLCIDRQVDQAARNNLTKDLGWIGFGLTTLDEFSGGEELTSEKWLFMDMET